MPELKVLATSVFDLGVDIDKHDLDLDRNGRRLFSLDRRRSQVVRVVEVELLDWRELRYRDQAQHQVKRFADRALADVVRADERSVPSKWSSALLMLRKFVIFSRTTFILFVPV